jgi:hypothetical protein
MSVERWVTRTHLDRSFHPPSNVWCWSTSTTQSTLHLAVAVRLPRRLRCGEREPLRISNRFVSSINSLTACFGRGNCFSQFETRFVLVLVSSFCACSFY